MGSEMCIRDSAAFGEQEGAVQIQSDAEQAAIEEALKAKNHGESAG